MIQITFEQFTEKLEEVFDSIQKETLTPTTKFRDLADWTSMNAMILVALYETEFDKSISFEQLRKCETVQDLYQLT